MSNSDPEPLPWDLPDLEKNTEGIWVPRDRSGRESVSYPDEGNDLCFGIEDESFWFAHRNRIILDSIRRNPPEGAILDVGGGNGMVTKRVSEEGYKSVLLEPGYPGCVNARTRGVQTVICSTLEEAGFPNGSVRAFGLFDVLEHVEEDVDFLQSLLKAAAPESYLYLTVPALSSLWSETDVIAGHFRRYSIKTLKKAVSASGWKVEQVSYFFTYAVLPIYMKRILKRKETSVDAIMQEESTGHTVSGILVTPALHLASFLDRILTRIAKGRLLGTSLIAVLKK